MELTKGQKVVNFLEKVTKTTIIQGELDSEFEALILETTGISYEDSFPYTPKNFFLEKINTIGRNSISTSSDLAILQLIFGVSDEDKAKSLLGVVKSISATTILTKEIKAEYEKSLDFIFP
jgi:hypothetical protein